MALLTPMMPAITYFQLINQAMRSYREGDLQKAYDLVTDVGNSAGGNPAQIMNFRYCLASKLGNKELALKLMREAVVDKGYWWGYEYLLGDNDLEPLHDCAEFQSLAEICRTRELRAQEESKPSLKFVKVEEMNGHRSKLLMALHGNGDNVAITEAYWLPCLKKGFDLSLPQSSQITSWDAYTWADLEKGLSEFAEHLNSVQRFLKVRQDDMVLAGFSGGARLALRAVIGGEASPGRLILVAPWLPELDSWAKEIRSLDAKEIECWIVCGDQDGDCLDGSKKLGSILELAGIRVRLEIVEGLDHDYPIDFEARLSMYLDERDQVQNEIGKKAAQSWD